LFVAAATRAVNYSKNTATQEEDMDMKKAQTVSDYLISTYLVGLFAAVGVAGAITAVLVMWPPLAYLAARFF
jgi:hypothetical protein